MELNRIPILSLFTGAGALDFGFEETGRFVTDLCVEYQPEFCETLRLNQRRGRFLEASIAQKDVRGLSSAVWERALAARIRKGGVIGGPPCESFSSRGKRLGLRDARGTLIFEFFKCVERLRPAFFLFENVARLARIDEGSIVAGLELRARTAGYAVSIQIVNCADYGAATSRKRLFIIGMRGRDGFEFPAPTHAAEKGLFPTKPYVTVGDALAGLPPPADKEPAVPQAHVRISHRPDVVRRFAALRPGQEDPIRKRTKLRLDAPSPTLLAGNLSGIRSHIHPSDPRELSNRESARLHGFPDDYEFHGNHAAIGKQIANSVPIPVAKALAEAIAMQLKMPRVRKGCHGRS